MNLSAKGALEAGEPFIQDSVKCTEDRRRWFVMTSPDPKLVEECLRKEGKTGTVWLYFIPYRFLERRIVDDIAFDENDIDDPRSVASIHENNSLRATLKRYIFIKSDVKAIERLLENPETKDAFRTLWWMRDRRGKRLTVPTAEMEQFINACCDIRIKFDVCPVFPDLKKNEQVKLKVKGFEGRKAWVIDTRHSGDDIEYVCGFHIFAGTAMMRIAHLKECDIVRQHVATASSRENNDYKFIEDVQRRLFAVAEHRIDGDAVADAVRRRDEAVLEMLNNYRYRKFATLSLRLKYCALMLLCAALCRDIYGVRQFVRAANEMMESMAGMHENKHPKDAVAYLNAMLYIVTGDISCYEKAKRHFIALDKQTATWLSLVWFMENRERMDLINIGN